MNKWQSYIPHKKPLCLPQELKWGPSSNAPQSDKNKNHPFFYLSFFQFVSDCPSLWERLPVTTRWLAEWSGLQTLLMASASDSVSCSGDTRLPGSLLLSTWWGLLSVYKKIVKYVTKLNRICPRIKDNQALGVPLW